MLHRTVNITLCNLVGYTDHVHFPYVAAQAAHFIANVWLLDCNLWGHKLCHFLHLESENQNSLLVFAHSACRYKKICKVLHRAVNIYFYQATNHTKQCMLALCMPEPRQFSGKRSSIMQVYRPRPLYVCGRASGVFHCKRMASRLQPMGHKLPFLHFESENQNSLRSDPCFCPCFCAFCIKKLCKVFHRAGNIRFT